MSRHLINTLVFAVLSVCLLLSSGCSSRHPVNFKIHTEPEGAHVIYRQDSGSWIYLGITPLDVVELMKEEQLEDSKFSLKTMRCGYLEQVKQWTGEELLEEIENEGVILWTPRLVKNAE